MHFSERLLQWYAVNGRPLPWRQTNDPYVVWITEIILQQTRVDQGMEYFYRFIEAFPDVASLAAAPVEAVLRLWQGLGYYSRARNLHAAARQIIHEQNGRLPQTYHQWLKVKGVGPYTAAAIASIAFNQAIPAVDGNVSRVLSRLFAIEEPTDSSKGQKIIQSIAAELIHPKNPGAFNQAMMDFGATICKPASPDCHNCIFNRECLAFLRKSVDKFPVKKAKRKPRKRYFNYFFFFWENKSGETTFLVNQRNGKDIWKNLFEFPLIETDHPADFYSITAGQTWQSWFGGRMDVMLHATAETIVHQLTHQTIHASIFLVKLSSNNSKVLKQKFLVVNASIFEKLPKSKLMILFWKKIINLNHFRQSQI